MNESYLHKGLRRLLAEKVRDKGIEDERIIEAINKVPRHLFMDSGFVEFAYKDRAFPIGAGQTISQPYTVAFQTELLSIRKNDKVLEIGTGSGYQAAILMEIGAKVYTIERQRELFLKAHSLLPDIGYRPNFFFGDGNNGLPTYSPFDKIIITASTSKIPENLLKQLKIGGKLVAPVGSSRTQIMMLVEKTGENEYKKTKHGYFSFVPLLKGTSK